MKFSVSFKDADALHECVSNALHDLKPTKDELEEYDGDKDEWKKAKREELMEFTEPWLEWGEYVNIEFDTEKGTATVETVK